MVATLTPTRRDQQTLRRSRPRVSRAGRERNRECRNNQLGLMWHVRGKNYSRDQPPVLPIMSWAMNASTATAISPAKNQTTNPVATNFRGHRALFFLLPLASMGAN